MKNIPQYEPCINYNDRQSVRDYITGDNWITEFKETREFEHKIASHLKATYCSVVCNGTISLSLALLAGGVKAGDKVIVPNLTMIATANAVTLIGAIPVLVDVNPIDLTLDYELACETFFKEKVKAIIYVTLNGRSSNCYKFKEFCKENNSLYISDDAQSLGSLTAKKETIGTIADISSFSFSMPKIITTGQGGCLTTNNEHFARKIIELRDFGREKSGVDKHPFFGINAKFTDLQAVLGNSQMEAIDEKIKKKKDIYHQYQYILGEVAEIDFLATSLSYVCPWFVDIYVDNKEKLAEYLKNEGIGSRPIYPPIHTQGIYSNWKYDFSKQYSNSIDASIKGLWLPSSLNLTESTIELICDKIKKFYGR
jgi:perosamine synthetase